MNEFLNDDQIVTLIASLTDAIQAKADEVEMANSYARMLEDLIHNQNKEIAALKAKLKAKVTKVTKVAKEPDLPVVKSVKMIRGNLPKATKKVATEAPAKRKPGRPKKVAK